MLAVPCLVLSLCSAAVLAEEVDYETEIQPLFEQHCYSCHGAEKREGGLRLNNRRDAFASADSGEPVIVPHDPGGSLILQRVASDDDDVRMPPEGEPLTADEITLLRSWIASGAKWEEQEERRKHWAYVAPVRPALPDVKQQDWPANAIDRFILAQLEARELAPSEKVDKARLIRRVSLALTGLPPTIAEVDDFLNDPAPDAYEKVVDRLLRSSRYGERWAQHWLDLARYADSNGFQADQLRDSWAYRDWVIQALNANLPFDQFVIEQLAGDLLPDATVDQKIATGFHRTVTCNVEAGVHPEENRVNQIFDRVNTTGTVFLGTTLECAQCHDHKYDPFTQREYYQLFAYFNNTPLEVKQTSGVTFDFIGPKMTLPLDATQQARWDELDAQYRQLEQEKAAFASGDHEQREWEQRILAALKNPPEWRVLPISTFASTGGEDYQILKDHSVLVGGSLPDTTVYTITANAALDSVSGFRIEALTDEALPGTGPGRGDATRTNFILSEFSVQVRRAGKWQDVPLAGADADFSQTGWTVDLAIDGKRNTGWAIAPEFQQPHWASFRTTQQLHVDGDAEFQFTLDQNYGRGRTLGRVRISALVGNAAAVGIPDDVQKLILKSKRTATEKARLDAYYAQSNPTLRMLETKLAAIKKQQDALQPATTLVMTEMNQPRETHVLLRGDYLNPGADVQPGVFAELHPPAADLPPNRLGLARWLVSPENPLLARVTVNRWWAELLGQGIVATVEDFGTQCEPPTHPELLDWLAVEFVDSGWSMKHMHKLMVMSATFQQAAQVTSELLERDPTNKYYARGPRFRLSAEAIRDNGLAISGLLSTKMGGPPIMPFQPENIWRAVGRNAPKWTAAKNEDRFRRGVYVVWRRAAPYPSFVNFDAPDRGTCVVQRPRTNTPLQALTLLNDPAYAEMALALAFQMLTSPADNPHERATYGFRRCLSRFPTDAEREVLVDLYQNELTRFQQKPNEAEALIAGVQGFQPTDDVDRKELAAWFFVANTLLNLDETITP